MLSRLAPRAAKLAPLLRAECGGRTMVYATKSTSLKDHIQNWERANELYFGPERDLKNFPRERQAETSPPTRMQFLPESWFNNMYEKTGVLGPYIIAVGIPVFLCSKEYLVVTHNTAEFPLIFATMYLALRVWNNTLRPACIKYQEDFTNNGWHIPYNKFEKDVDDQVEKLEKSIWREDGQKYLFEAKKENVDLQLEEEYRRRQAHVYEEVKKRLDYQVDCQNTRRRLEQSLMVDWIVDGVKKGITAQQEKESIMKCISDLKQLSQKVQVA